MILISRVWCYVLRFTILNKDELILWKLFLDEILVIQIKETCRPPMWGLICCSTFGHVSLSDWPSWMLLKANLGSTRVIMESGKNHFWLLFEGEKRLHEGGGRAVWGGLLEGCRVVAESRRARGEKKAVAAEIVRGASPAAEGRWVFGGCFWEEERIVLKRSFCFGCSGDDCQGFFESRGRRIFR